MNKELDKIILLDKKEGKTPLEAVSFFRDEHPEYKDIKMTYAGRLDPMASGLLLILSGDKVKEKEEYLALDKDYDFEVLFGVSTDTYDVLGLVENVVSCEENENTLTEKIEENLYNFTGKFMQKYPLYSSKTVKGKPLFQYARRGQEVEAPEHEVSVRNLELLDVYELSKERLLFDVKSRIARVSGDFRQGEIIKKWEESMGEDGKFLVGKFKITCGSGTYIRVLANDLGCKIGLPALAYFIRRTRVGVFEL